MHAQKHTHSNQKHLNYNEENKKADINFQYLSL